MAKTEDIIGEDEKLYRERLKQISYLSANDVFRKHPNKVLEILYDFKIIRQGFLWYIENAFVACKGMVSASHQLFLQDLLDTVVNNKKVNFKKYSYMLQTHESPITTYTKTQQADRILKLENIDYPRQMCPSTQLLNVLRVCKLSGLIAILSLIYQYNEHYDLKQRMD